MSGGQAVDLAYSYGVCGEGQECGGRILWAPHAHACVYLYSYPLGFGAGCPSFTPTHIVV